MHDRPRKIQQALRIKPPSAAGSSARTWYSIGAARVLPEIFAVAGRILSLGVLGTKEAPWWWC